MHFLITGGTGFIGSELIKMLVGNPITLLTRNPANAKFQLRHADFDNIHYIDDLKTLSDLNHVDAIINLAGEPIADKRWTEAQKKRICDSRFNITQQLTDLILNSSSPPQCFISGSAVGYYGDQQNQCIDEQHHVESDQFAHQVCHQWEQIALQAQSHTRVCLLRTGIVLGHSGGALDKMLPPFQFGVGGPIGKGEQYMPWIHLLDMIRAIQYLLDHPNASGIFNLTAPHPVKNAVFAKTLARALRKPSFITTPKWAIKLLMGEASCLVFDSARVKPKHLTELGFTFAYPHLSSALKQIIAHK